MKLRLFILAAALVAAVGCDKPAPTPSGSPQQLGAPTGAPLPKVQARADDNNTYKVPVEGSPSQGSANALVTMVEFTDYQCPFCSRANTTVKQLQGQYGDKLRVVMKQNPLPFHNRAKPAALAALAAGEQGKYWELHHKLFENAKALEDADLERYAGEVGLDVAKWKEAMQNPKYSQQIDEDQKLAQKLGASGTPSFFINGRKMVGAQPPENFAALIDEELGKAQQLVAAGTPAEQVYAKIIEKGVEAAPQQPQRAPPPAVVKKIDVPAESPSKGPKTAKVTIVEWSDFQCPFCSRVVPTLKQIQDQYGKDVRIVFRHQPLPFHNNAKIAAEASMAAHEQGKFWEMHDKLFANAQALDAASLEKYAGELGLNAQKFKAAMESHKYAAQVEKDSQDGMGVGANGTPTFFINGRQLVGAQPFESFKAVIDEEMKKADKLLAEGVKPDQLYAKLLDQNVAAAPVAPTPTPGQDAPAPVQKIEVGSAPVKGDKNAPVTIVEYSDFQCPFCSRVVGTMKQIQDTYGNKVKFAFKHQPLPFHNNARIAAAASMAAHEQGKFWEMHDKLFANQQNLDRASLERYAEELGLNMQKFKAALDSNKYEQHIANDQAEAGRVGANGTPTFYINGRQLVGAQPFEQFKAVIDEELKKTGK